MFVLMDLAQIAVGLVIGGSGKAIISTIIDKIAAKPHRPIVQQIIISMADAPKDWKYYPERTYKSKEKGALPIKYNSYIFNEKLGIGLAYRGENKNSPTDVYNPIRIDFTKAEGLAIQKAFEKSRCELIDENLISEV